MTRLSLCLVASVLIAVSGCGGTDHGAPGAPPGGAASGGGGQGETPEAGGAADAATGQASATPSAPPPAATPSPAPALVEPDLGYNAREGRALYRHYCSTCHGDEGHGDGFNAYNLDPKPRDLADPAFQAKRTDDDLAAIIRSGGGVAGMSTGMPPWGRTLNERQIRNIVDYVRTRKGSSD